MKKNILTIIIIVGLILSPAQPKFILSSDDIEPDPLKHDVDISTEKYF